MKNLSLLLFSFMLVCTSCKKEEKTVTPAPPTPASMTALETAMVGKWFWDKSELYSGGTYVNTEDSTTLPTVAGAYIEMKSSYYNGTVITTGDPQLYEEIASQNGTSTVLYAWHIDLTMAPIPFFTGSVNPLGTGGGSYIDSVSATTLILTDWSGSTANGYKHFYSK